MQNTYQDNLILVFSGPIDERNLQEIIAELEKWLNQMPETQKLKRKIITVSLEFMQNIILHSCEKNCTFIVKKEPELYNIIAGSWIMNEQVIFLKQEIDKINHYSEKQLSHEINEKLQNDLVENTKGAGIGLLYSKEIADGEIKIKKIDWDKIRSLVRIEANINR